MPHLLVGFSSGWSKKWFTVLAAGEGMKLLTWAPEPGKVCAPPFIFASTVAKWAGGSCVAALA